ncbi:hypothetical protein [Haloarcula marismortui]|uniref:hypothetical protein n=1 Tax=Haloarcula marismortui TaxID=2238 RepID=UPI0012688FCB|nr:hypothetical protein [Haloarcula californiae]
MAVDDEKSSRDRVTLAHEDVAFYDPNYYQIQLIRTAESVLSSHGFDRTDIQPYYRKSRYDPERVVIVQERATSPALHR